MMAEARLILILGIAGAALLGVAAGVLLARRWRRKSPEELERLRRLAINRRGRITAGYIADLSEPQNPPATLIVYKYEVAGVSYEVAQDVTRLPTIAAAARRLLGHIANVKYDPKNPSNSIIACEDWCGVTAGDVGTRSPLDALNTPRGALEKH